jgi:alanyl-tRNA synthetase
MTAAEIRQSFLDFFKEKQHTIVPSASLLPQSPGLLFTNAGMNPFVPYFLGVEKAPYDPPRAADTQKCIRAGGKHNDLEDVGYDTYHHTFFEMLGNWSFGNYFKKEAIQWAWELVVERWGLPAHRLHASVYAPKPGDPGEFDQEAYDIWAELYRSKGCDPAVQIVNGNVKDNFWMMGETGPCGPCSELHVNLTPEGDPATGRLLVNNDSDLCIEIWNLVFIQYNAEADGSFRELPAKHIDTGMGFERACSIIQGTKRFTDFSQKPSNYATDVFQPIFRKLEELSGKSYVNIYPALGADRSAFTEEMKDAIAFRVIADHLRTLSFSIADGIMPGNNGRNYVLRRILRRAVRYGRQLGFSGDKPFFGALVETLVKEMGGVFPELKNREDTVRATFEQEEASFNQTLDRGLKRFDGAVSTAFTERNFAALSAAPHPTSVKCGDVVSDFTGVGTGPLVSIDLSADWRDSAKELGLIAPVFRGDDAFELEDTFGFPIDLTELLCLERGLALDKDGYESCKKEQQDRSRAAQKTSIVRALDISTEAVTEFLGFDTDETEATILEVHPQEDALFIITDKTVFYAEMGGQAGDTGTLVLGGVEIPITGVQQVGKARAHVVQQSAIDNHQSSISAGSTVTLRLDSTRRRPIEAHHSATHLLHWALHEVVSKDAAQQGSSVDENRLRFDFNSAAVTPEQIAAMEEKVNAAIQANDAVSWKEVPHASIKGRPDIMQFFGDKYGDLVRVVQIGGGRGDLTGYSMELCGGTHVRNTGEIGLFKIKSEGAIASGVRRIEAACGEAAWAYLNEAVEKWDADLQAATEKLKAANDKLATIGEAPVTVNEFPHIMGAMLVERADISQLNATFSHGLRTLEETKEAAIEAEKRFKKLQAGAAAKQADAALAELIAAGGPIVATFEADASLLQELLNGMKKQGFTGAGFVIVDDGDKLHLGAYCGDTAQANGLKAGDLLRDLAALAGGKGGGKPDQARGAAPDRSKIAELEAAAKDRI